jgi:hypothetical protein
MPTIPTPEAFLLECQRRGIKLTVKEGTIKASGKPPANPEKFAAFLKAKKPDLLALLSTSESLPRAEVLAESPLAERQGESTLTELPVSQSKGESSDFCRVSTSPTPSEIAHEADSALGTSEIRPWERTPYDLPGGRVWLPPDNPKHWEEGGLFHPSTQEALNSARYTPRSALAGVVWHRDKGVKVEDIGRWLQLRDEQIAKLQDAEVERYDCLDAPLWTETKPGARIAADLCEFAAWWRSDESARLREVPFLPLSAATVAELKALVSSFPLEFTTPSESPALDSAPSSRLCSDPVLEVTP